MAAQILVAWIGKADLKAASADAEGERGPIGQAVTAGQYDALELLCNYSASEASFYRRWIATKSKAKVKIHQVKLTSPTNFSEIYESARHLLDEIRGEGGGDLTYHLSPGTPAMQAVWILLAKSTHPARLIQSSIESGVEEAHIPFDIAAEFIPQLLGKSDERLTAFGLGGPGEGSEFADIVHRSPVMKRVLGQARRIAIHSIPVLIEGESGTGKELMARAIHKASPRAAGTFVAVNCGAIPPELVESEFFGHKKGSFTGAVADRKGHFELAHKGTIFLDEIGELPKAIQVKLLRTLQEREVTPVGSSEVRKIDTRVIAATNRTLISEVAGGRFREDLFYRLAVAVIQLPPLRERKGDISLLIDSILAQVNASAAELGIKHKKISASAKNLMLQHMWPGNVRELFNTLQRAAVWSDEESISIDTIRDAIMLPPVDSQSSETVLNRSLDGGLALDTLMAEVATHYIDRALSHTNGNKTQAAKILGIKNYQTLTNWITRYGIKH
jgi:DNA-binding NtrC family response regulator